MKKYSCSFVRTTKNQWKRVVICAKDMDDANDKAEKMLTKIKFGKPEVERFVGTVMSVELQKKLDDKESKINLSKRNEDGN